MELASILLREIRQAEKDKCVRELTHMCNLGAGGAIMEAERGMLRVGKSGYGKVGQGNKVTVK